MVAIVTPGDLSPNQFSIGGEVANQITVRQDFIARTGVAAPVAAPAADESPFFIDTSTTPQSLYHWDGGAWNLLGDGAGAGADGNNFITGGTLSGANILTLTGTGGAGATVDLSALAGGGGGDGVLNGGSLSGTNQLVLTRSVGADITVDLSSLAGGGGGGGAVNSVTGTAPIQVGGTAADPVVSVDLAALVTALCANAAFQDCIKTAAIGLIRDDGDGTFTAAHATDGAGNYVYTDCP